MNGKRRRAARERLRRMRQHSREREDVPQKASTNLRAESVNGSGREAKEKVSAKVEPAPPAAESIAATVRGSLDHLDRQRQHKIDALERDAFELSRLTNPTDRTSSEVERIRREIEELRHEFYAHLGA